MAARFRQRHARLGVILSLVTTLVVGGYAWFGQPKASRAAVLALGAASAAVTAGLWVIAPRAARHRRHGLFFAAWSGGTIALILIASSLDGGADSPITHLLFLPLIFGALAYRPSLVLLLGAGEILGFTAIGYIGSPTDSATTIFMVATLGLAALMAAQSARNSETQAGELHALTVQLESLAIHDDLTACLNRRGFDTAVEAEILRSGRYGHPLSLLLIDVDHLKAINDERGHAGGDAALRQVAAALRQAGRRTDIDARLGGDEFALLVPETEVAGALEVAERIHAALRAATGASVTVTVTVTVSIGAAALDHEVTTADQLLRAADQALFEAKEAGRNRTAGLHRPGGIRRGA